MNGTNWIKINHETLVEALQLYLDAGQMPNQKVQSIYLSAKDGCYLSAGQKIQDVVVEVTDASPRPSPGEAKTQEEGVQ